MRTFEYRKYNSLVQAVPKSSVSNSEIITTPDYSAVISSWIPFGGGPSLPCVSEVIFFPLSYVLRKEVEQGMSVTRQIARQ